MARSSRRKPSEQSITDEGSVSIAIFEGEQLILQRTANWFTNLAGSTVEVTVREGDNTSRDGTVPTAYDSTNTTVQRMVILDNENNVVTDGEFPSDYESNSFRFQIPEDLADSWTTSPGLGDAGRVYAFYDVTITDAGSGDEQQVYKPEVGYIVVRGKVK